MLLVFVTIHIRPFLIYRYFLLSLLSDILEVAQNKPLLLVCYSRKLILHLFENFQIILHNKRDNDTKNFKLNNK